MPVPAVKGGHSADKALYLEQQAPELERLLLHPLSKAEVTDLIQSNCQDYFFVDPRGMNTTALLENRQAIIRAIDEKVPDGRSRPKNDEIRALGKPRQLIDLFGAVRLNEVLKGADLGAQVNQILKDANLRAGLPKDCLVRSLRVVDKARFEKLRRSLGISKDALCDTIAIPRPYGPATAEHIANHFCRVDRTKGSIYDVTAFAITDRTAEIVVDALNKLSDEPPLSVEEAFPLQPSLHRRTRVLPLRAEWGNLI